MKKLSRFPEVAFRNPFDGCVPLLLGLTFSLVPIFLIYTVFAGESQIPRGQGLILAGVLAVPPLLAMAVGARMLGRGTRQLQARQAAPSRPWEWDYDWDPRGMPDRTSAALRKAGSLLLLSVLWVALWNASFLTDDPEARPARYIALGFDLLWLLGCGRFLYLLAERIKYGAVSIRFRQFPFQIGGVAEVLVRVRGRMAKAERVTATLRCIASARGSSGEIGRGARFEETITLAQAPPEDFALRFPIPEDAPPTALSDVPMTYWDLEVKAQAPGVDYDGHFLLPIYRVSRGQAEAVRGA